MRDFINCPRLYYLRNVYKDPKNNHKFTVMTPPLALGGAVHDVVESLSVLPVEDRLAKPLDQLFELAWTKVEGEKGGFDSEDVEKSYKDRGLRMLKRVEDNPGPVLKKAVKIQSESGLPYYWLSEEEEIILCGKVDWLEYIEDKDAVHIYDFKTSRREEDEDSLQLPIYSLLVANTQKREIDGASYWYLDMYDEPTEQKLPEDKDAFDKVFAVAKRVKLARQLNHFNCRDKGCRYCIPYEKVIKSEGKKVGVSEYGQDIYIIK